MYKNVNALVLREVKYRDADKILTVLTAEEGKLTVKARGALRKNSKYGAAAQLLCFSHMTLLDYNGRWSLSEAETLEQFLPLRSDLEKLALGTYFAEALEAVSDEDCPNPALLQLGLNSLYALGQGVYAGGHIKAVFELRLMCLSGFAPALDREGTLFSVQGGRLHQPGEPPGAAGPSLPLDPDALRAMRYIVAAEPKKLFSFSLPATSARRLEAVCEAYLCAQLERGFGSLDYWKQLKL